MTQIQVGRRAAGIALASVTSLALLAACGGGGDDTEAAAGTGPGGKAVVGEVAEDAFPGVPLTFVSYGGMFQEGQEAAIKDFGKITGAELLSDGPTLPAKLKAMVDADNVTWDVVDTGASEATKNCGTLFMPLDFEKIDISKTPEGTTGECFVPAMSLAEVLIYDPKRFDSAPETWADFFDTDKFPGKRGISGLPGANAGPIMAALLADGVAPEDLYPLDIDRAITKLETIKDDLVFWKTGAELQQMLESGEVPMAYSWSGRGKESEKNGANLEPAWGASLHMGDSLAIPMGVKNPDAAHALINFYLGKDQQEIMTEKTSYSPVNVDAQPEVDELTEKWMNTQPEKLEAGVAFNYAEITKQYDEISAAWTKFMGE
ncbi:extracellular solute-binding protein [Aeromicrobium sp. JJY06]|uniref:extracellular solute-binding protein n=1 Tax=Aeromicrobium sp. JJY06 TaxID=3373478 RepID=UPI00376EBC79